MLEVTVWGSRGSVPSSGDRFARYGGATTCLEIVLRGASSGTPGRLIIDCGTGLAELGKRWGGREAGALVLQTHMHWDHVQGFPFFGPLFNAEAHYDFWAVPREGYTLKSVLERQMDGPMFPVGLDIVPAKLSFRDIKPTGKVRLGELELAWTEVCHPSGSTAWRLTYRGASMVFTGDVEVQQGCMNRLVDFAQGAELMIMDAQYLPEEYKGRAGFGHSTPLDAVEVALKARVGQLLMTHHDPSHDDERLDHKCVQARQAARGQLAIDNARDGLRLGLEGRHGAGLAAVGI